MPVLLRISRRNVTLQVGTDQFLGLWLPGEHGTIAGVEYGKIHFLKDIDAEEADTWYDHLISCSVQNVRRRVKSNGDIYLKQSNL